MPQARWSNKRERQYQHIKEGLLDKGKGEKLAEEIAARTVNKDRARAGETETASRTSLDDISLGGAAACVRTAARAAAPTRSSMPRPPRPTSRAARR